jgi:hypothetical protein
VNRLSIDGYFALFYLQVVSFEDLQNEENNMSLHKPVYCPRHPAENMKYFCSTCQVSGIFLMLQYVRYRNFGVIDK